MCPASGVRRRADGGLESGVEFPGIFTYLLQRRLWISPTIAVAYRGEAGVLKYGMLQARIWHGNFHAWKFRRCC